MTYRLAEVARRRDLVGLLIVATVILAFYGPIVAWLAASDFATAGSIRLAEVLRVIGNTLGVCVGAATIATALGLVIGTLADSARLPARSAWLPLVLLPFFLPSVVITTAAQAIAGPRFPFLVDGYFGAVLLTAWVQLPIVIWGVVRSLERLPADERLALRALCPPGLATWRVLLPRALPLALKFGFVAAAFSFARLEIAEFAGVETIGVRIIAAFTALESAGEGWLLVGLTAACLAPLVWWLARRLVPAHETGETPGPAIGSRTIGWGLWLFVAAQWLPLLALGAVAFDAPVQAGELELMTTSLARELARSLVVAVVVIAIGFRLAEWRHPVIAVLLLMPLFLPGSIGAFGLSHAVRPYLPDWVIKTTFLMSFAQSIRLVGVGYLFGVLAVESIPLDERRAAEFLPPGRRRYRVLLPRAAGVLATGAMVVFVLVLGEVESAHQLAPPGILTPVLALYQMLHFRFDEQSAQVSIALVGASVLVTLLLARWGRGLRA